MLAAVARLPRGGAGIVFRHYATPIGERRTLYGKIRRLAQVRRIVLLLAGNAGEAMRWRADGWHAAPDRCPRTTPLATRKLLRSTPCHNVRDIRRAWREGADLAFLSPVFATRSHPGEATLGAVRFGLMTRGAGLAVMALGGMNAARMRRMAALGAKGWGAIDAWSHPPARSQRERKLSSSNQNLKMVPR